MTSPLVIGDPADWCVKWDAGEGRCLAGLECVAPKCATYDPTGAVPVDDVELEGPPLA